MTLHQLTHTVSFDLDFAIGAAARRVLALVIAQPARWAEARRVNRDLALLGHRERADLASRG
jgi:hypothetical protein